MNLFKYSGFLTLIASTLFINYSVAAPTKGSQTFEFNLTVPKNTCNIQVVGTSNNIVDFGNVALAKLKSDSASGKLKLPFSINLSDCRSTHFDKNYITIDGNFVAENNGYLDDAGSKTFAIRISDKENAVQSDDVFFNTTKKTVWDNISENEMSKQYYAYLMCKDGMSDCASDANIGAFKATFTLTYVSD
ncbi:fimbrial protein [Providencia sp. PROV152]|uniref:Type 1 fimbrial protein n=1 Tax=Providencia stuartii TaxID=588 RepID=A0AAI9I1V8_PROST|nr:fimbrial protein [Providencia sp. PROV152]ELR5037115.1 type 1 fimbrial protein [Providencia stuartii]